MHTKSSTAKFPLKLKLRGDMTAGGHIGCMDCAAAGSDLWLPTAMLAEPLPGPVSFVLAGGVRDRILDALLFLL